MAVKKDEMKEAKETREQIKVTASSKKKEEAVSFCVYIGPNIRGVIQSNAIFEGTKAEVIERLVEAIAKYPLIEKLIVTNKTFASDRVKVNQAGNVLNVYYKGLMSGNMN